MGTACLQYCRLKKGKKRKKYRVLQKQISCVYYRYTRRQASTTGFTGARIKVMYIKDFDSWNTVKKRIEQEVRFITLRRGEIRWCSLGVNIGAEIDGKGVGFTRPVLVLRVIGSHIALVAPLSTKLKDIPGYIPINFQGKMVAVCANHIKMLSQKRIYERQGKLSDKKFIELRKSIFEFLQ